MAPTVSLLNFSDIPFEYIFSSIPMLHLTLTYNILDLGYQTLCTCADYIEGFLPKHLTRVELT